MCQGPGRIVDHMPEPEGTTRAWGRSLEFWTRTTLVWLMAITVTGAAVRLTGSGLGCTDWPACSVNSELEEAGFHSAVEFGNRIVSGLAILPVIAAFLASRSSRPDLLLWIRLLVVGFVGQVLLGMLVTRTELDPRVVLGHFLLSMVLIFGAAVLDHRARRTGGADTHVTSELGEVAVSRFPVQHAWALVMLTSTVVFVGTLVTGSGPHTGSDGSGEAIPRLGFAIRDITRVHSVLVWVLIAALLAGLWHMRASTSFHRRWLTGLAAGAAAQGSIGYAQYFTGVPVLLVGLHIAGAVLFWTAVVWYAVRTSAELERVGSTELVGAT